MRKPYLTETSNTQTKTNTVLVKTNYVYINTTKQTQEDIKATNVIDVFIDALYHILFLLTKLERGSPVKLRRNVTMFATLG